MKQVTFARWVFAWLAAMVGVVLCLIYLWQERYFLRFLPIPLKSMGLLYDQAGYLPVHTPLAPRGKFDFPEYDLTTEQGLRDALNRLQLESPFLHETSPHMNYKDITFNSWLEQMKATTFYCTDASMLFMLTAWDQGLMARQWQLLTKGWQPGQGHSIVEFFNPKTGRWLVVDPQHAGIIRDRSGNALDMKSILEKYESTFDRDITVDYGPYDDVMKARGRGPTTEDYFFKGKGLSYPVLTLRAPTWYATAVTNDLIIGYPVFTDFTSHKHDVFTTKIVFLLLLLLSAALAVISANVIKTAIDRRRSKHAQLG